MNLIHMNFKHILAGGASFAVLALLATNINVIMPGGPLSIDGNEAPVSEITKNIELVDVDIKPDVSAPQTTIGHKDQVAKLAEERTSSPGNRARRLEKKEMKDAVVGRR